MASLFWVGGTGTWDGVTNHFATTTGGSATVANPTSADDVFFDGNSGAGTVTINKSGGAACHTLDFTGFTGSVVSVSNLFPTGNVVLAVGGTFTGMFCQMNPPNGTTTTITFNGRTIGALDVSSTSGTAQFADAAAVSATMSLTKGGLDTNSKGCTWGSFTANFANTKTLTMGTSAITITGTSGNNFLISNSTITVTANSAVITLTGSGGGVNFNVNMNGTSVVFAGTGNMGWNNGGTVANVTLTGPANKTGGLNVNLGGATLTITGTLTINGNSAINRVLVFSAAAGTAQRVSAAVVAVTNADFQDITALGAGNWDLSAATGGSGDCGGNTGITFTPSAAQTWAGASGALWSANAWTSRVPLPQDDVVISSAFIASQTIHGDMPRLGHNIDFTGTTGTPTFVLDITGAAFGNITLAAGMQTAVGNQLTLSGRGAFSVTSNGVTFAMNVGLAAPNGTYTIQDTMRVGTGTSGFVVFTVGTLVAIGKAITANWTISGGAACALTITGSTLTCLGGSGVPFNISATGTTLNAAGSTIVYATPNAASSISFSGAGLTYGTLRMPGTATITALAITGNNTFANLDLSTTVACALTLPAGGVQVISGGVLTLRGLPGQALSIVSSSPGTGSRVVVADGSFVNLDSYSPSGDVTIVSPTMSIPAGQSLGRAHL